MFSSKYYRRCRVKYPWGSKTLCSIQYDLYLLSCNLKLISVIDAPTTPIRLCNIFLFYSVNKLFRTIFNQSLIFSWVNYTSFTLYSALEVLKPCDKVKPKLHTLAIGYYKIPKFRKSYLVDNNMVYF